VNFIKIRVLFLQSGRNIFGMSQMEDGTNRSQDGQGRNMMLPVQHRLRKQKNC